MSHLRIAAVLVALACLCLPALTRAAEADDVAQRLARDDSFKRAVADRCASELERRVVDRLARDSDFVRSVGERAKSDERSVREVVERVLRDSKLADGIVEEALDCPSEYTITAPADGGAFDLSCNRGGYLRGIAMQSASPAAPARVTGRCCKD